MRMFAAACRAVFVELIGVVAVLWLLFGTATWTVDSYRESSYLEKSRSIPAAIRSTLIAKRPNARSPARLASASQGERPSGNRYVAHRLDHYSRFYREAAGGYLSWLSR